MPYRLRSKSKFTLNLKNSKTVNNLIKSKEFSVKFLTTKFSMFCLHIWLVKNRLDSAKISQPYEKYQAIRIARSLKKII